MTSFKIQISFKINGLIYWLIQKKIYAVWEMTINLFIVGGGAEIKNFLTFDKIYPDCKVYKLEQNYRSTKNI